MAILTLLDLKKIEAGLDYPIIEESIKQAPELSVFPAEQIAGTSIELTVRTDLPTVAFRNFNEGTARSKSTYKTKVFQTAILDHQVAVDKALLDNQIDPARVLMNHAVGATEAAMRHIGSQVWYGTSNDAKGFPGLIAQMPSAATHNVDATGSTNKSSVFFATLGRESLSLILGKGSTINMGGDWAIDTVLDGSSNPYQAYVNWLTGAVGLRLANKHAVTRIKNIESTTKKLTDTLMFSAYELHRTNYGVDPTHIFMNIRSQNQLRAARTATNATGAPVPLPRDWEGIPIIITQSITSAETI